MQILIFILLLCSFSVSANLFEDMKCGAYEASKYPNKTEFKGSAEREVSDSGVKEFFDELGETDSSQRQWVFKLVDRATGKYKKSFPRRSPNSKNEIAIEHQIIQPEIIITLGDKIITGSNNGEFGGELLLIDENDSVTLIKEMNVEDIYEMPFGLARFQIISATFMERCRRGGQLLKVVRSSRQRNKQYYHELSAVDRGQKISDFGSFGTGNFGF